MNQPSEIHVFDRALMRQRRARVASDFAEHDFLYREVAARLHEKLSEINRSFGSVLDMGSRLPVFETGTDLQRLVHTRLGDAASGSLETGDPAILIADEEALPFADASFDLVVSNMALHWVNDLPGCLIQVKRALRPDGLFLAAMLGGETLHELRASLMHGEMEIQGGVSPRVSPFADIRDIGGLLQRAGFALPTVDIDEIVVSYRDMFQLMKELRGMGETNVTLARRKTPLRREVLMAAARYYSENFPDPNSEEDGRITATFQILNITAWAPHPDQPQPLRPGSAKARLADALGVEEVKP